MKEKSKDNVLELIKIIELYDEVICAEPNYYFSPETIPNDTNVSQQWNLIGDNGIDMTKTWDFVVGTRNIKVGVIDTGIINHNDLNDNLTEGYDFYNNNNITSDDSYGHGTKVAGIIGAVGNNSQGVTGINQRVTIVPMQVSYIIDSKTYIDTISVKKAIQHASTLWGTESRISILNYSAGVFGKTTSLLATIEAYPGLFVWAAGNDGVNIDELPNIELFNLSNLISVGAHDKDNERSVWSSEQSSNYGNAVNIYAPGGKGFEETNINCLTTDCYYNSYSYFRGTSCAAPHVTGVAALLLSLNKELTSVQLKQAILEGAEEITITVPDTSEGADEDDTVEQEVLKLNAFNSVKYVLENYINSPVLSLSTNSDVININKTILTDAAYFNELNGFYKLDVTSSQKYEFILSSTNGIEVTLYDEDFTEIPYNDLDTTNNKVHFIENLSTGTYYLRTKYANEESTGTINTEIFSGNAYQLTIGYNDILLNYYNGDNREYYFINSIGPGFYKFTIEAATALGDLIEYPDKVLKVYDEENQNQELKYNVDGRSEEAENDDATEYMYMYLEREGYYYIHVDMIEIPYSELKIKIERLDIEEVDVASRFNQEFTETIIDDKIDMEYVKGFNTDQTSVFTLNATLTTRSSEDITLILFRLCYNNNTKNYYLDNEYADELPIENKKLILEEGTYYIGYFNNSNRLIINVSLKRLLSTSEITDQVLVLDPNEISTYGTEVRHNGGIYNGTIITEGFTRHLHFENITGVPSTSRYDYNFYSSNNSYATVSAYGTVFAKAVTGNKTVTITAEYKQNIEIIFTIEITIIDDTSNLLNIIESTQNISLSDFVDNKYKIVLDELNSPYPWFQYYDWEISTDSDINVSIDSFGYLRTSGSGSATLVGEYTINSNVIVIIHINFIS